MVGVTPKRGPQFLRSVHNRPALRRRSGLAVFGQLIMVASGIAFGGGLAYAGYGYAASSNSFLLRELALDTVPERMRALVRQRLEPAFGRNLLMLDLNPLRKRLESIPQVRTARLRRLLPKTLEVEVSLRGPWGRFHAPDGAWLVSKDGVLLAPDPQSDLSLPRLRTTTAVRPELGTTRQVPQHMPGGAFFDDAVVIVDWLREVRRDLFGRVAYVQLEPTGVALVLAGPQRVLVGDASRLQTKFDSLRKLAAQQSIPDGAIVDLRYRDMVVVRQPEADAGRQD
jgi:hypothetical protein